MIKKKVFAGLGCLCAVALVSAIALLMLFHRSEPHVPSEVIDNRPVALAEIQREIREADSILVTPMNEQKTIVLTKSQRQTLADFFTPENAVPVTNSRKRFIGHPIIINPGRKDQKAFALCDWNVVMLDDGGFLLMRQAPHDDPRLPFNWPQIQ